MNNDHIKHPDIFLIEYTEYFETLSSLAIDYTSALFMFEECFT